MQSRKSWTKRTILKLQPQCCECRWFVRWVKCGWQLHGEWIHLSTNYNFINSNLYSRASTCMHLQCFDASLYVQMNERKPTWWAWNCFIIKLSFKFQFEFYMQELSSLWQGSFIWKFSYRWIFPRSYSISETWTRWQWDSTSSRWIMVTMVNAFKQNWYWTWISQEKLFESWSDRGRFG